MDTNDRALYFDRYAAEYDAGRPDYPPELYKLIEEVLSDTGHQKILEIGAGNGAASAQILDFLRPQELVLLEPGENFCGMLRNRYARDARVKVIEGSFETYDSASRYDVIIAATAWHWIDENLKYDKAAGLLSEKGHLVLFWNNFRLAPGAVKDAIDEVYARYETGDNRHDDHAEKMMARKSEVETSAFFEIVRYETISNPRTLSAEEYSNLVKTYPDHEKFGNAFVEEIAQVVHTHGAVVLMENIVDVIIAKKSKDAL
jgi:SAM-dependent methyltransferase